MAKLGCVSLTELPRQYLNAISPEEPHRVQEWGALVVARRGHQENDRASRRTGVYPVTHTYGFEHSGNDSVNVDKIIEKPPSVDPNIWKYEHVRQFVL